MLDLWLQCTPNATWEDVVRALEQMGEKRVAENILQIRGEGKSNHDQSKYPQVKF